MQYLEDKGIIQPEDLEKSQSKMDSLVKDLLKLDLKKFKGKEMGSPTERSPEPSYLRSNKSPHHQRRATNYDIVSVQSIGNQVLNSPMAH